MLTITNENKLIYILKAGFLCFFISIVFGFAINNIFDFSLNLDSDIDGSPLSFVDFLGYVIIAPVIETLLMRPIIKLIKCFTVRFWGVIICSAVIWSCLHSLLIPTWGLFIFTSFIIFSTVYLRWEKYSTQAAFSVTASIHALHNFLACMMVILL